MHAHRPHAARRHQGGHRRRGCRTVLSRARFRQRLPQFAFSLTRIGCGEAARVQALGQRHIRRGQSVGDKTLAGTGNEQAVAQAL